jgi:glycosyltransferase involved in cell wall biosynthesis
MLGDWQDRFTFLSQALQRVDYIVTASRFLRTLFANYGVPPEKIRFSPYGLDTFWVRGYESKTPSSELRIGFIGQIIPIKGVDILLKAFNTLEVNLPVQLKIYGNLAKNPTYGRKLRQLADDDRRISFLGTFENTKMGQVLSGIDVLAVPSIWYDFPLVVPSAFAAKTPVIATNLAGLNELVHENVDGLLFERYDWQGLARHLRRLARDPDLMNRLRAGIAPVKTLDQMTNEYLDIYGRLVAGQPPILERQDVVHRDTTANPLQRESCWEGR